MAVPNLNSGERMEMFRELFFINRSFYFIVQRISNLENAKKLNARIQIKNRPPLATIKTLLATQHVWVAF